MRWLLHVPDFVARTILFHRSHSTANAMRIVDMNRDWSGLAQRSEGRRQHQNWSGRHHRQCDYWHYDQQEENENKSAHVKFQNSTRKSRKRNPA
jgi:hypothetical protein